MDRPSPGPGTHGLTRILVSILRHRRFLFWNSVVVTVVAVALSFLLTVQYRATATLLPPQKDNDGLLGLGAILQQFDLGNLSLGGGTSTAQVYLAILSSRTVADAVIEEFDLVARYKTKNMEYTRKRLWENSSFKVASAGVIEISVQDRDRETCAALANAFVEHLDRLNRTLRMLEGQRTRVFVEERLAVTMERLTAAEDSLRAFQEAHPGAVIPVSMEAGASAAAEVLALRISLATELELLRQTLQPGAAPIVRKAAELASLDRKLTELPSIGLEIARRYRDFMVQEKVFELLTVQYEQARVQEFKDVTTVDVLDAAVPPVRKSFPRRSIIAVGAMVLSFIAGLLLVAFREGIANLPPADTARLKAVAPPGTLLGRLIFGWRVGNADRS